MRDRLKEKERKESEHSSHPLTEQESAILERIALIEQTSTRMGQNVLYEFNAAIIENIYKITEEVKGLKGHYPDSWIADETNKIYNTHLGIKPKAALLGDARDYLAKFSDAALPEIGQIPSSSSDLTPAGTMLHLLGTHNIIAVGEASHKAQAPKRLITENLEQFADAGVRGILLEHLLQERCQETLNEYLHDPNREIGVMPKTLKNELEKLDESMKLMHAEHNFTSLVQSVKQHNLTHPGQEITILAFDTNVSYSLGTSKPGYAGLPEERQRSAAVSYLVGSMLENISLQKDNKVIVFVGAAHIAEMEQEKVKGIGEICQVPAVLVEEVLGEEPESVRFRERYTTSFGDFENALTPNVTLKMHRTRGLQQQVQLQVQTQAQEGVGDSGTPVPGNVQKSEEMQIVVENVSSEGLGNLSPPPGRHRGRGCCNTL